MKNFKIAFYRIYFSSHFYVLSFTIIKIIFISFLSFVFFCKKKNINNHKVDKSKKSNRQNILKDILNKMTLLKYNKK